MEKVAAIYARVSTDEQAKGFSLDSQVEQLKVYLEKKGYTEIEVFIDDGYSGKDYNQPNIQRLFRNLDKFEAIAVWKVDRLSRNNEHVLSLINNYLKPYNKKILVSTCDIDSSTSNGYMFISLLGTFAEYERTQIVERVYSGMKKRYRSGKWNGGVMLGYDINDGNLYINEHESTIVKEIFELRASGHGYKSIVNHVNIKGYKTKKNNHFGINSIKTILANPTYAGYIRWGNHMEWTAKRRSGKQENVELVKGVHEPIICEELWENVKSIGLVQKSFKNTSNFEGEFVLSGILKCPKCGNGMVMHKTKMRNGKGYYLYYQCQSFHQKGLAGCNSNLVTKDVIEKSVLRKINNLFLAPEIVEDICKNLENDQNENVKQYSDELQILRLELNKKVTEEVTYINKLRSVTDEEDNFSEISYKRILAQIIKEKEEIEKRIDEYKIFIQNHSTVQNIDYELILEALKNFHDLYEIADSKTKKLLLKSLIKKIELEDDRKTIKSITFWFEERENTPPPPSSVFLEGAFPVSYEGRTVA